MSYSYEIQLYISPNTLYHLKILNSNIKKYFLKKGKINSKLNDTTGR